MDDKTLFMTNGHNSESYFKMKSTHLCKKSNKIYSKIFNMTFHGNDDVNYSTLILANCKKLLYLTI